MTGISERDLNKVSTALQVILTKVGYIEKEVDNINSKLEKEYVTQDQFEPVKKIVYGLVSVILLAVIGALTALVIKK